MVGRRDGEGIGMDSDMVSLIKLKLEEQHLPCEWRLEWHKTFHTVEIVLLLEVVHPPDNTLWDKHGSTNYEDTFIFEDSILLYDRQNSKIRTDEYLASVPFDRKKGMQGGLVDTLVKNIRLTVNAANNELRDFLLDRGEPLFEMHWNEQNFLASLDTLKKIGRYDETYYRYPKY
jgi:hypothetical protein